MKHQLIELAENQCYLISPDDPGIMERRDWDGTGDRMAAPIITMTPAPQPLVEVPEPIYRDSRSDGEGLFDSPDVCVNMAEIKEAKNINRLAAVIYLGSNGEYYAPCTDGDGEGFWFWLEGFKPVEPEDKPLVVTRHDGLVDYLIEKGLIPEGSEVISHASPDAVRGRHVWGVLPHSLSCLTASFTEVPLRLPAEMRGKELTSADVQKYAGKPVTYKVEVI